MIWCKQTVPCYCEDFVSVVFQPKLKGRDVGPVHRCTVPYCEDLMPVRASCKRGACCLALLVPCVSILCLDLVSVLSE